MYVEIIGAGTGALVWFIILCALFPNFMTRLIQIGVVLFILFVIYLILSGKKRKQEAEARQKAYEEFRKPENILADMIETAQIKKKPSVQLNTHDDKYVNNAIYVAAKYGFTIANPEYYERTETLRALMKKRGETEELDFKQIFAEREAEKKLSKGE